MRWCRGRGNTLRRRLELGSRVESPRACSRWLCRWLLYLLRRRGALGRRSAADAVVSAHVLCFLCLLFLSPGTLSFLVSRRPSTGQLRRCISSQYLSIEGCVRGLIGSTSGTDDLGTRCLLKLTKLRICRSGSVTWGDTTYRRRSSGLRLEHICLFPVDDKGHNLSNTNTNVGVDNRFLFSLFFTVNEV